MIGAGPEGDQRLDEREVEIPGQCARADTWNRPVVDHGEGGRDVGARAHEHLVAGADAGGGDRQLQRGRSAFVTATPCRTPQ